MLKHFTYKKIKAHIALITLVLFIAFLNVGCGKRKPPVPPTERIPQRTTVSGIQQGNRILLSWKMPVRNGSINDSDYINRVDVYRLAEPISSNEQITEEDFASRSTLIHTIQISTDDFSSKTYNFSDTLEFSAQSARLIYAVKFVNQSGQKASFSNFLTIQPSPRIAQAPKNLKAEISQEAVSIIWEKPETNVDGSTPVNILGFNIYRNLDTEETSRKINQNPISDNNFEDRFFEFEKSYTYFVRTVSIGTEGEPIESVDSQKIQVKPVDTFPPSPPESITIAASPNSISLFFAANPEKDILGYNIYRSKNNDKDLKNWEILNNKPLITNTFVDQSAISGTKYFYYITAVDKFGNVSQPSQIVSETVP